ncbi:NAD+ synthase [Entomoplasma freundtii]|uniref:NH(3)-dependent NAD(+) synthetase n=1 Tax=Entomoplasma freundtii TaxID=74700 RepID=A0A2K8NRD9_9MOLU|nr:NAD(+) synthase [Entomoplasma freundtii]ATZ16410.1 NH(3)-dependent NAD(+) synthetase [Entomoplasma freundtii]TDY56551.1 NAD+ synthase [Entomoplasma freundtii]
MAVIDKKKTTPALVEYLDYLVKFIQKSVANAHADGVIVGVSGGVDSAVVALLAKKAFPNNYQTVWMPLNSSPLDYQCVAELVEQHDLKVLNVDLAPTFKILTKTWTEAGASLSTLALANSKARLRMTTLYGLGQSQNYLVLGTDNADEWYLGYFTKYGDGGVDVVPLVHLLKGEVFEAARLLGVPASIINRAPTASLWDDQTDEKELGFSYDQLDDYLRGENKNKALKERVEKLHTQSEHKRQLAIHPKPFLRLTNK